MYVSFQDFLSMAAQLSTVFGFAYGLFWLERHRKEKVIEHQSDDAKKALDQLVLIEELLDTLYAGSHAEQKEALEKRLLSPLRGLYKALLLLKDLPNMKSRVALIGSLSDIVHDNRAEPESAKAKISQLFTPVGGYKKEFKWLKEYLLQIYTLRA